jgi:hypothetical protein
MYLFFLPQSTLPGVYVLGNSDFDARMFGRTSWKGDENLKPVYKKNRFILAILANDKTLVCKNRKPKKIA